MSSSTVVIVALVALLVPAPVAAAPLAAAPVAAAPLAAAPVAAAPLAALDPETRFHAPPANPGAERQADRLRDQGRAGAANKIEAMANTPQAVWLTQGTPADVREYTEDTVAAAKADGSVPIFAVYNVPGRDCSHYSGGGAATGTAYRNWIDAVVDGLGEAAAVMIVEPDGLALLPSDCDQPDPHNRLSLISYAAHAFLESGNVSIYIDAGNSNWLSVPVIAERLVAVGVEDVDGFALNVSNFQFTRNSNQYGTWVSKCIAYATQVEPDGYDDCPDQYGSWGGVALSSFGKWSDAAAKANLNTSAENARYNALLGSTQPSVHFVVDTSRNARGPWKGTSAHPASESDTEAWCNPLNRGAGTRTTAVTHVALVDLYVWVKLPGESDGECFRWTDGPRDPARKRRDPQAGAWFGEMALELMRNAVPGFQ